MLQHYWAILLIALQAARCQDVPSFTVPKNWRSPTSNKTVDESITLVNAVVDTLRPLFNSTNGQVNGPQSEQNANVFSAISLADYRAGTTTHKDLVMTNLNKAISVLGPNIDATLNSVVIVWGLAAIDAYRAYEDLAALNIATSAWDRATQWFITPEDVARGSNPLKNVSIASSCYNGSTAGGVFYLIFSDVNTDSNGETVAAYLALTALLSEVTSGSEYATNAQLSALFIQNNLYNGTFVEDTITVNNCARTDFALSYNTGYYLLGLSVLASKNSSWVPFIHSLIASSVPYTAWTSAAGIDIEGQSVPDDALQDSFTQALKGIYVRGLYEAWNRSTSDDVRNYVKSWITVQYNALQDQASLAGSNQYSPDWQGPAFETLLPWGQLSALDVLSAGIGFAYNETSPALSPSRTSTSQPTATWGTNGTSGNIDSKANIGAIVGGIIGGVVVGVAVGIFAWTLVRRRRRRQQQIHEQEMLQTTPLPFQMPYADSPTAPYTMPFIGGYNANQPSPNKSSASSPPTTTLRPDRSGFVPDLLSHASGPSTQDRNANMMRTTTPAGDVAMSPASAAAGGAPATGVAPGDTLDFAAVPELIEQLNRIMARLPPGGIDEEAPPRYDEA